MKELPSKETLEAAMKAANEIRDLEARIIARGYGVKKIKLDDGLPIYSGIFKSGVIRLMAGDRPIGDYPCAERIGIWNDVKGLLN